MKTKADLKKIARKIWHLHQGNVQRTPSIMHPNREWVVGIIIAVIGVTVVGSWSGLTYLENRELVMVGVAIEDPEQVVYAAGSVEEALAILRERAAAMDAFDTQIIEESISGTNAIPTSTPTTTPVDLIPLEPDREGAPEVPAILDGSVQLEN